MNVQTDQMREIFLAALKVLPEQRSAYIQEACAGDESLRQRIERLLQAHLELGSIAEPQAGAPDATHVQPAITEHPGAVIGPYRLLQQIGEGGMGTVWMAEQTQPVQRKVALKLIKPGMDSRQVIARFEAERQALAMMDHVNIARVFDGGTTENGRPYFVMELVHGIPITKYCDDNHLTPRERLELFVPVCQAIQHAHQKGIIHRDIKPSNVMVTLYDGRPVPKVIDFGVAKATEQKLTERTLFTQYGIMVGTLEYMSPEQAEMSAVGVDTRSDIYSLGVLLYELLTGGTPLTHQRMKEAGYAEILRMIKEEEPPKPSTRLSDSGEALASISANRHTEPAKLTKLVRGELDWIVMKALEKDRNRRYETANGLAMDLQRYLTDEPVRACPPTRWYRFRKFVRRNKAIVTATGLVALALLVGAVVSAWQAVRATWAEAEAVELAGQAASDRDRAVREQRRAENAERGVKDQLWRSKVAEAAALRGSGQPGRRLDSLDRLDEALTIVRDLGIAEENKLRFRNDVIASLALPDLRLAKPWKVALPKSRHLIVFDAPLKRYAVGADATGAISVRRTADHQQLLQLAGPGQPVALMRFSPDGHFLAAMHYSSADLRHQVRVWDLDRQTLKLHVPFLVPHSAVEFSPNSRQVAVGEIDGSIRLYDLPGGAEHKRLAKGAVPYHLAFHPDGSKLAVSSFDSGTVQVRDLDTGDFHMTLQHPTSVRGIAWRGDGKMLAAACGLHIALWDAETGKQLGLWAGHENMVIGVAFSQRGDRLASNSWEPFVRLWDVTSGRQLMASSGSAGGVYGIHFSPDDRRLAHALEAPRLGLWDIAPGHECRILVGRLGPGHGAWGGDFSADGRLLAVAGRDAVHLWDVTTGEQVASIPQQCNAVHFTPDGKSILTTGSTGLQSWPMSVERDEHAQPRMVRVGPPAALTKNAALGRGCLSRDGQLFVAGAPTPRTAALIVPLDDPSRYVWLKDRYDFNYVSLSPDKRRVASGSFHGSGVKIWDAQSGKILRELPSSLATTVAFSPDGQTLATCTADAYAFWDVTTWQPRQVVARDEVAGVPGTMAFAPNGKVLAIAHAPSLVQLRDPATGRELATLRGPSRHDVPWLRFSRDGALLAVGCANDQVQLWDLRLIRKQLTERGLDWDLAELPAAAPQQRRPLNVEIVTEK